MFKSIEIVKTNTVRLICNPFNKPQIEFVDKAAVNPFLDHRYISYEYVTATEPFIFIFITAHSYFKPTPNILFKFEGRICTISQETRFTFSNEILCKIIKSKDIYKLRDIVEREILLMK